METKIKHLGNVNGINLHFDPLRNKESFLVMKKTGHIVTGFFDSKDNVLFESNANLKSEDVVGIICGVSNVEQFKKIIEKFNEKV
jgi:hypothetical protein